MFGALKCLYFFGFSVVCLLTSLGPAFAEDAESVTISLSGYIKPVCGFVGDGDAAIQVDIGDLGGPVVFEAPINCNTPFDYSITAGSGVLISGVRAQAGFHHEIPYVLAVDFGGEDGRETLGDCAAKPCTGVAESSSGARLTFTIPDASRLATGRKPLIAASYAEGVTIKISARM